MFIYKNITFTRKGATISIDLIDFIGQNDLNMLQNFDLNFISYLAAIANPAMGLVALPTYLTYIESGYASEARTVMSNINNASKMYYQTRGEWPGDVEQLERSGQLDLDRSTKLKWTFELQLPDRLSATSTEEMTGGAGKVVSFDALTGKFKGYGSPEDSQ